MKENSSNPRVLVTGGTGYIGSHAVIKLIEAGFNVVILDNLSNSHRVVIDRIEKITGVRPVFVEADIRDREILDKTFQRIQPGSVMHFAGLKAVGESVEQPEKYQDNNVNGTRCLLEVMAASGVKTMVFSSSATVYGDPDEVPIREDSRLQTTNPYGQNKLDIEHLLAAQHAQDPDWRIARLRYFNPVGAHSSGWIGEDPNGIPNNLMPFISQVAVGRLPELQVFGNDYDTPDGTGVRDYIHVVDLARGHVDTLRYLEEHNGGLLTLNLGTGQGVSVLQMVAAFEQANGISIPFRIVDRRPGDVAECWADPALARDTLNWRARRTLVDMCRDSWRWQQANPEGYRDALG